jgi:predicted Zn-ribbon and HTH transcriptional regulator
VKKPKPKDKKVHDLVAGDLFLWEQEICRFRRQMAAGSLGRGERPWKSEIIYVKALDRKKQVRSEIMNAEMTVRLVSQRELAEQINCCDGFEHEGCEVWDCPACPKCMSHHSAAKPGGACCPGLSKPGASDENVSVRPARCR